MTFARRLNIATLGFRGDIADATQRRLSIATIGFRGDLILAIVIVEPLPPRAPQRWYEDARYAPRFYTEPDPFTEDLLRADFQLPTTIRRFVDASLDSGLAAAEVRLSLIEPIADQELDIPSVLSGFTPYDAEEYDRLVKEVLGL